MIHSRQDLNDYLASDNAFLRPTRLKGKIVEQLARYPAFRIRKYLRYLRKQEYYINTAGSGKWKGLLGILYERKKNRLGESLGMEIAPNTVGKGVQIWHAGCVINDKARIGENCIIHGNLCIGNNGVTENAPVIGNNVDIGYGAVIVGNISIANGTMIGANSFVNRSVENEGYVVAGSPAKVIKPVSGK